MLFRWLHLCCRTCREQRHLKPPESLVLSLRLAGWEELELRTGLWQAPSCLTSLPLRTPTEQAKLIAERFAVPSLAATAPPPANTQRNESTR